MSTPTKVLHIAPTPFFSNRGCHIRIRNVIGALTERGLTNVLCTYHHGRPVPEIDTRRIPGVPGYRKTSVGFSPFKFLAGIPMFFLSLHTAWREKPDLIHGHLHEGALLGWLVRSALFWRNIPVVMDMQGSLSGELSAYGTFRKMPLAIGFFRWIEGLVCRMPSFFFCSSEDSRELLIERFGVSPDRVAVTDDGVREDFFRHRDSAALRASLDLPADRTIVIYTGSFLEGKGVHHVLEAAKRLTHRADILFVLIGYPAEMAERWVRTHGLETTVRVLGEIDYEVLPNYLGASDLALEPKEPGSGEASGKLIHYMGAGLPVVCFESPNNRRFLGPHGFFADSATPDAFTSAIEYAASPESSEPRTRFGEAARTRAHDQFSWEIGGRTMIAAYATVLGRDPVGVAAGRS